MEAKKCKISCLLDPGGGNGHGQGTGEIGKRFNNPSPSLLDREAPQNPWWEWEPLPHLQP